MKLTITEYSLTTSAQLDYKKSTRKELYIWYCVCVVRPSDKTHDTNDHQDPEHLPHSAHEPQHVNDARVIPCTHSPVVRFWSSWSAHHIVAQVQVVRIFHVIHACSGRYSSTLSSPFHPTSSSSHSLSIFCISCCTSSTTLRVAVTLRISPEKKMDPTDESYFHTLRMLVYYALQDKQEMKAWRAVAKPMRPNQNVHVFWMLVNLQDCVWENHCRLIMKTILQEKESIHCSISIWCANLFFCFKPWKFPRQRKQWTRNVNVEENSGVEPDESQK